MKRILLFLAVIGSLSTLAQDAKYCKKIKTSTDDFTKIERYRSPQFSGLQLFKTYNSSGGFSYTLTINTGQYDYEVTPKGVSILFEDGTVLDFPKVTTNYEISTIPGAPPFTAFSSIPLSPAQMDIIASKLISKVRQYNVDTKYMLPKPKTKLRAFAKCLIAK